MSDSDVSSQAYVGPASAWGFGEPSPRPRAAPASPEAQADGRGSPPQQAASPHAHAAPSTSPRGVQWPPRPAAADDGPVRCVSPPASRPMSSAGARVRGGGSSVAASAAAVPLSNGARGGNPLLRASNVALPSDFPEPPSAAARRSVAFRSPLGPGGAAHGGAPPAPPPHADDEAAEHDGVPMPSSSDDEDGGGDEGGDRPAPLPLPLSAFGPRPLSRDPEMEAKLAASARAEATLSAHDLALIARMSGPLRRVTLRPATAGPAAAARLGPDAAAARFDASGGRAMAAASQWAWGGAAEAGQDDDDDEEEEDDDEEGDPGGGSAYDAAALKGQRTSASSAHAPRMGRGSAGGGAEVARPAVRVASGNSNSTFQRAPSSGRDASRDMPPPGAEPEPTDSPRMARRSSSSRSSSGNGGMARAGDRIARSNAAAAAAAAAAAVPPPAESPRAAWPPPMPPRPSPGGAGAQRPFTAAANSGPRARTAAASGELESFLARQEAYNKLYREKAARLRAAEEEAAAATAHRPAVNAASRRMLEANPAPSLLDRRGY